jgi:hypothetical protein
MAEPVDEVGPQLEQLDLITPEQSLTLMSNRIGRALAETEREEALKLAEAVGYLPIAMDLVAALLARKTPWSDLICTLEQEVARLEALSGSHRRRKEETRLDACFNLSLNTLRDDDIEVWLHFVWLGVLPDDALVAAPMAATLWGVLEAEAARALASLLHDALLLPSPPIQVGERTFSAYRLHHLLHDVARRLLTTNQTKGLGIPLAQAHASLLKRYRVRTQSELWHTLADDGYIHARLSWHLEKAGWVDEIHKLLREETSSGRNGWHEACERRGRTAIFVTDVAHAWRLAEDLEEDDPSRAISLQCRYALIVTTLNSLTTDLPHSLVVALVQKHIWVPEQGLAYALQSSNPQTKASLLTEIIDYLPQNLKEKALQKALAATRAIQYEVERVNALRALAPKLPPKLLPEALAIARAIPSGNLRFYALGALAPKLPPELLPEALAIARAFRDPGSEWCLVHALSVLADKLPSVLPEALAAARAIEGEGALWYRANALSVLADKLPSVLPEALAAARAIEDYEPWGERAIALRDLADKLPSVLPEALAAARAIEDEWYRADALSTLADKLPSVLPEALATARAIQDEKYRADALSTLAPKLPPELLPEALALARGIQDEWYRAKILSALAGKLPELLPEALAIAKAIQYERDRAKILSALADKLPPELLPEALALARAIQDEYFRASALSALADLLPEVLPEALALARAIQDEWDRGDALSNLASKMPEVLPEALATARVIEFEEYRVDALLPLADLLPEVLPEVLAAARAIEDERYRAIALSNLASKMPEVLPEALAAARAIEDERYRVIALSNLASKMPEVLPEALATARTIQNERERAIALSNLADLLPSVLAEALATAKAIQSERERAKALIALAPKLSKMQTGELFPLWQNTLHSLSNQTRQDFLHDIPALATVICALGDPAAVAEVATAIQDVGRWWP